MFKRLLVAVLVAVLPFAVTASTYGSKEEAQAMAERAAEMFEAEGMDPLIAAVSDPSTGNFHDRDLYVFVFSKEGVTIAHGVNENLVGRNMIDLRDVEGHQFIRTMIDTARNEGRGWVDYIWQNPQTKQPERKTTYVVSIDDNHFLGVGAYAQ